MGWIIYGDNRVTDPQAECDRIVTWDNEHSTGRVIVSRLVGNVYYAAHERADKDGSEPNIAGLVLLIQRSPFGYKDMDESMGPSEARAPRAPRAVLEALPPLPPEDWSECQTCKGTGILSGPDVSAHYQGKPCYSCEGAGERERHAYARDWRKRCWSQFGGEPQGVQLDLLAQAI